jgi:hypothetical protein
MTPQLDSAASWAWANRDQGRDESARERLQRFTTVLFVDAHPEFRSLIDRDGVDDDGLERAAEEVLAAHHQRLLQLESPVELPLANKLARDRFQAITALIYKHGDKQAKETLLRITAGAPLTICMGDVCRIGGVGDGQTVSTMLGEVRFAVKGCRTIFSDVVRTDGGRMWPGYCPRCRSAHRKPGRTQSRALRRRLNGVWEGKTATIYERSVVLPPRGPSSSDPIRSPRPK